MDLKYTYEDLARRWNVSVGALRVRKHRGQLPDPDEYVPNENGHGTTAVWYESTIKQMEETDGISRSSGESAATTD